jgi:predicted ATP-grasp superfamily ATP-dependent carboligase
MSDLIRSTLNEQESRHLVQLVVQATADIAPDPGTAAAVLVGALASLLASLKLPMSDVDSLAERAGREIRSLVSELRRKHPAVN